jgi:lipoprotein-anchoring transpeptidase ErfK/SrfK
LTTKPYFLARALLVASLAVAVPELHAQQQQQQPSRCHWWQFGHCDDSASQQIDGLPADAPRSGTVVTVDVSTNTLYLFRDGQLVRKSAAATGSGKTLENGDDMWQFDTPRGHLKVRGKIKDPVWRKPDWAFVEAGERVPPPDSPKRLVKGHLGKYALALGDGIMIHGTDDADSIGKYVSHGCIRVPDSMLDALWKNVKVGTDVYVFESRPPQTAGSNNH